MKDTVVTSVTSVISIDTKSQFRLASLVSSSVMEERKLHRGVPNCDIRPNHTEVSFGDYTSYSSYHSISPKVSLILKIYVYYALFNDIKEVIQIF